MKLYRVMGVAVLAGCFHGAPATTPAAAAPKGEVAAAPVATGSVEERLARLEAAYAKNAEALEFLNKVYAQQKAQQEAQEREEPAEDAMFAVNVVDAIKAGQVEGPASAPVTIVKAFDFACPYCARTAPVMEELVKEYGGKVRVVYANMIVHPVARPAHLASCAAAKQGKYKEFKRAFWDKGFAPYAESRDAAKIGEDSLVAIAKGVGLNVARLKADMAGSECEARIQSDMAEMAKFHVNATPTFFVNGKHVGGALSKEAFKELIDAQLKIAEASGVPGADYYAKVVLGKGEHEFRSKADPKP